MFRKMIALLTVFAMLVPLSSAVVADENTSQPKIEEILNSYHEKAFAAQTAGENGGASTYARSGSGSAQTLEQETVAELTAAGYEAYNVTGDNYEALEETLQTDFAEMGLDPNSSYVVVIGGEYPSGVPAENSQLPARMAPGADMIQLPSYGDDAFAYTYEGTTYYMRYVTVASDASKDLRKSTAYTLQEIEELAVFSESVLSALADVTIGYIGEKVEDLTPIISFVSFLADWLESRNPEVYVPLGDNTLTAFATTVWTFSYIQVLDQTTSTWKTMQASSYATSRLTCAGYLYNTKIKDYEWVASNEVKTTTYSVYFNYPATRWEKAIKAYQDDELTYDCTGDIYFNFYSSIGTSIKSDGSPLFIHKQPTGEIIEELGG